MRTHAAADEADEEVEHCGAVADNLLVFLLKHRFSFLFSYLTSSHAIPMGSNNYAFF